MKTEQIKAMIAELGPVIREFVASEQVPLLKRIAELEARQPLCGEKGDPGARGEVGAAGEKGDIGPPGEAGRDGKDAAPISDDQIFASVARYMEANPPAAGRDGEPGAKGEAGPQGGIGPTGPQGERGAPGTVGEKGADGRDGVGLAGAVIDRGGDLVVTLTNGEHKNLGPVLGKDGRDGDPGMKGTDGRDGADGLGFDDLDLVEREKGLMLRFARGDAVKEYPLPVVIDQGVWREGSYAKGSGTSWAGSFWIAQRDTSDKPDTPESGWRLAVKRGRDGKDGKAA